MALRCIVGGGMMAGRPTKYSDETAKKIVLGIRAGLTDKDAALAAGISEPTLARWRKRYDDFDDHLVRAHAERAGDWLANIRKLAGEQRDWRAYAELLDRCAPEYRKVHKSESTVTVDVRKAAEKVAAELGIPADVVLSESTRWAEDEA